MTPGQRPPPQRVPILTEVVELPARLPEVAAKAPAPAPASVPAPVAPEEGGGPAVVPTAPAGVDKAPVAVPVEPVPVGAAAATPPVSLQVPMPAPPAAPAPAPAPAHASAPVQPAAAMLVTPPASGSAVLLPFSEAQLVQRVLADVQRQVDQMLAYRLREAMTPALTRLAEGVVAELRDELALTLRDVVARAVAQELSRHRGS